MENTKVVSLFLGSFLTVGALGLGGCGSSSNSSTGYMNTVPAVAPIVNSALPTSLKATSAFMLKNAVYQGPAVFGVSIDIKAQLTTLFKSTYGTLSGLTAMGYMNSLLFDMDSRMTELKTRFASATPSCTTAASQVLSPYFRCLIFG